jgi:hypothetical protein
MKSINNSSIDKPVTSSDKAYEAFRLFIFFIQSPRSKHTIKRHVKYCLHSSALSFVFLDIVNIYSNQNGHNMRRVYLNTTSLPKISLVFRSPNLLSSYIARNHSNRNLHLRDLLLFIPEQLSLFQYFLLFQFVSLRVKPRKQQPK